MDRMAGTIENQNKYEEQENRKIDDYIRQKQLDDLIKDQQQRRHMDTMRTNMMQTLQRQMKEKETRKKIERDAM